jgi:hypothetical protein
MTKLVVQFTIRERAQHFWVVHLWMDLVIAILVVAVWNGLAYYVDWFPQALSAVPADARRTVYQILATASATMGGFTLTSVSILVNLLRTPMTTVDRLLPADDKRRVGSVFLAVLPWLLTLFVASLVCLSTDANVAGGYWRMQLALLGCVIAAVCALCRVIWVLRRLLIVSTD